ncbi:hypothetical protein GALL_469360 [mine drainage metagenome]|uniref:Uncharacterized protein n=1 Tax=mine drainage metagenome TaxID=410659 RepID=A0A1J5PV42_9ZZZZ
MRIGQQVAVEKRQDHRGQPHADTQGQHAQALFQRDAHRRADRADSHAQRHCGLHHRAHGEIEPQCVFGPLEHDELEGGASAPEQCGDRHRDLSQLVGPQHPGAMAEIDQQGEQPGFLFCVARAGVWNAQIAQRRDQVHQGDDQDGRLGRGVDAHWHQPGKPEQEIRRRMTDQKAAEHGTENDGSHRGALDPAVGSDQLLRRQQLGEDAVLGRGIRSRTQPDHAIGQ